jgi:23S rRNA pseudouridine1911/1915/1917 synthase
MKPVPIRCGIELLYEDPAFLAVRKPAGMLSQKDHTGDEDLITICSQWLMKNRPGNNDLAPVHRLDRPVAGLMLLARNRGAAAKLSGLIRNRQLKKGYLAICHGKTAPNGYLVHHLLKQPEGNRSKVVDPTVKGAKKAELTFIRKDFSASLDLSLIEIQLMTGRHHQIRVQMSQQGHPLLGDQRYGSPSRESVNPALFASTLRFEHPVRGHRVFIESKPDQSAPWTVFADIFR